MVEVWAITFLVLIVLEILTVNLVSIWFSIGAVGALITAKFTDNFTIQLVVFILISIISLLITKPFVKKMQIGETAATNLDRVLGEEGLVTKAISKDSFGEVKVKGSIWTAQSHEQIKEGSRVKVLKIDGVKLVVEKVKEVD